MLDGDVAADVADAESAIARLNVAATSLIDTEALARILLRAESVASSKIEGLEVGARRLLRAEAARGLGDAPSDVTALEVLGNIDAMVAAIRSADEGEPMTIALLLDLHRRLLAGTRLEAHGGRLREVQNWIGGSDYNPCSAAFVPAPPELVEHLMVDLVAFSNSDTLPAVAQAAVAHAQFETIHPFVDGNGRTGRALIHLILRRRGLAPRVLPPVSLILARPRTTSAGWRPVATGVPRRSLRPTREPTCGSVGSPARVRAPRRTRPRSSTERKGSRRVGETDSTRSGLAPPPTCCSVPWWERRSSR